MQDSGLLPTSDCVHPNDGNCVRYGRMVAERREAHENQEPILDGVGP